MNEEQMAAKLYDCRDTAKRFFGDKYVDKIYPYKQLLQSVMKVHNLREIPALYVISKTELYQENPLAKMLFMAAVVELSEQKTEK